MKKITTFIIALFFVHFAMAQDTFSIVAVDSTTGEVGSAGATCLDVTTSGVSAIIISEIKPGKGAIHTQSYWLAANQQNASNQMDLGKSPQDIITWLTANDAGNNASLRQYGIADLDGNNSPRSAAFTGANCFDFKDHRLGTNYAIQGNILIGAEVLDSMEARFVNTQGSLADKLMAAMQGANIPGADSRCLNEGVSSLSAFIRVAKPSDHPDSLWMDLIVPATPFGVEPIDSLQVLFDDWKSIVSNTNSTPIIKTKVFPNPVQGHFFIELEEAYTSQSLLIKITNATGQLIHQRIVAQTELIRFDENILTQNGLYIITIQNEQGEVISTKKILK